MGVVFVTIGELMAAVGRRWYVALAVAAIAVFAGAGLLRDTGVFATRTVVSFMLPEKTSLAMNSGIDDTSVIAFAGVVAQQINNGKEPATYSTDEAPFYGAGVREGVLVSLPKAGNQWVTNYLRAEIQIQVIGATEQSVVEVQSDLIERVYQATAALQLHVAEPTAMITASVVPLTTRVYPVSATRSTAIAAVAALAVAALIVGGWLCVTADRVGTMWRKRRVRAVAHGAADVEAVAG